MKWRSLHVITLLMSLLIGMHAHAQLPGYGFYKILTVQSSQVSGAGALTDFPVMIQHTDPDLRSVLNGGNVENANGFDIEFTASDGITLLDHQLEAYDSLTGAITAWVRVPLLSALVNTDIRMYFGNASISVNPSTTAVWDANFQGVWHLADDELDGTNNTNHLSVSTTVNEANAVCADGQNLTFGERMASGIQPELQIQGDVTAEAWVRFNSLQAGIGDNTILGCGLPGLTFPENHAYKMNMTSTGQLRVYWEFGGGLGEAVVSTAAVAVSLANWNHFAFTRDDATNEIRFYINGIQLGAPVIYTNDPDGGANTEFFIGENFPGFDLDGSVDEARVSNVIRSSDWMLSSYNSMNSPGTFYTIGTLQTPPCGPTITTCVLDSTVYVDNDCNYTLPNFASLLVAVDGCGTGLTFTQSPAPGSIITPGVYPIKLQVFDVGLNIDSCSFNLTVTDTTSPVLTCPGNNFLPCPGIVNNIEPDTVWDNCALAQVTYTLTGATTGSGSNDASGTFFNDGVTTVTYTARDSVGNTSVCSFTVSITDNVAPAISCPANITQACPGNINGIAPIGVGDNCGIDSVHYVLSGATVGSGLNDASGTYFNDGATTVTYFATDLSGNTTNCSFTIIINDNVGPTLSCPFSQALTCPGVVNGIAPTSTGDNCGIDSVSYVLTGATTGSGLNDASGTFFNAGVTTVTYTITDSSGNTASCNFTITINDNVNPIILCPLPVNVNNDPGLCSAVVGGIALSSANDNCGIDSINYVITGATTASGLNNASGTTFNVGVSTVQYTITDNSGNTSTCSFNVTVNDTELPVISCPGNVNVPTDPSTCSAQVSALAPTGSGDNCGVDSVSYIIYGATTGSGLNDASGTVFNVGVSTLTYIVTDLSGNVDSCSLTITVNDNEAPQITCPATVNATNDPGQCSAVITGIGPILINDNCAIDSVNYVITGVTTGSGLNNASGTIFNVGTSTVTYYIHDQSGNVDSCSFNVIVADNLAPSISCPGNVLVNSDPGNCDAVVNGIAPFGINDNCAIDSVSYELSGATLGAGLNDASGVSFGLGTTAVKYIVYDVHGNADSCVFTISVVDNELPTITCPSNVTDSTDPGQCSAIVNGIAPLFTNDNCGVDSIYYTLIGATTGSGPNDASGSTFAKGTTIITYFVVDVNGNIDSCDFQVMVIDTEAPILICPANDSVSTDPNNCTAVVNNIGLVGVSDNCAIASISFIISGATSLTGTNDASGSTLNTGLNTIHYVVNDSSGNVDSCSFTVLVNDNQAPTITCPNNRSVNTDAGQCGAVVNSIAPLGWTENCNIDSISYVLAGATQGGGLNDASGLFFDPGVTTVSYIIHDVSGNMDSCSFTITVTDNESPTITCPTDIVICDTNVLVPLPIFSDNCAVSSVVNDYNNLVDASDVYPFGTTTVQYTVTDTAGNVTTCEFDVEVEIPPTAYAGEDQILLGVNGTTMTAGIPNVGSGNWTNSAGYGVLVNPSDPGTQLLNLDPGTNTFIWTVTNGTCPVAIDEIDITYIPLLIPNGFSPNSDGDNDYFVIEGIETVENQLTIFNRWGVELLDFFNYQNDWDGRNKNGADLPEDTYFFVLKIPALDKEQSGYIVLKR